MKEQEKNEIKLLSDKLDALNRKEPQLLNRVMSRNWARC